MALTEKCTVAPYSENSLKVQHKLILQPFTYLTQAPGNKLYAKLLHAFNLWLRVPDETLSVLIDVMDVLQNANLLLDDVQDNSVHRRGLPTAHLIYGVPYTINTGCYVIFLAVKKLLALNNMEVTKASIDQLMELHRGHGLDLYWRDILQCPTEEEYISMIKKKSGTAFALKLILLFTNDKKSDLSKLSDMFGAYYQIRDDYFNLYDQLYGNNKTSGDDLSEGKFSFPIIHAVNNQKDDSDVMRILRMRTKDLATKKYCISMVEKCGSFKYTCDVMTRLDKEIREEVRSLGGNPWFDQLMDELKNW